MKNTQTASYIFGVGIAALMLVPTLPIFPQYSTFIHPSRPELVLVIALISCVLALHSALENSSLVTLGRSEISLITLPVAAFCTWSGASALWAASAPSVLHHTGLWIGYFVIYVSARIVLAAADSIRAFTTIVMIAALVLSLPIVVEYHWTIYIGESPSLGIRYSRSTELLNTLAPLIAALYLTSRGRAALLALFSLTSVALANLASVSRTGISVFILVITGLLIATQLLKPLRAHRIRMAGLTFALAAAATGSFIFSISLASEIPIAKRLSQSSTAMSAQVRPFFANIVLTMWNDNRLLGVGADNFGQRFNTYRHEYAAANPTDPNLILGEAEIGERAHNEYLQILSELGIVGAILIAALLAGIAWHAARLLRDRSEVSIFNLAAVAGVAAFLISSAVTSYSFRLASNGAAFFVVLAIALTGTTAAPGRRIRVGLFKRVIAVASIVSAAALLYISAYRLYAVHYQREALASESKIDSEALLQRAVSIDPENANFYSNLGWNLIEQKRYADAPAFFREAIERGRSTSIDYSALAMSQLLNNNTGAALETLDEAVRIYPMSVFLRTRRAALLDTLGKADAAAADLDRAIAQDGGQALTWYTLITEGGRIAAERAHRDNLPPLMELAPQEAVYQIVAERELRYPDEKFEIPKE